MFRPECGSLSKSEHYGFHIIITITWRCVYESNIQNIFNDYCFTGLSISFILASSAVSKLPLIG